MEQRQELVLLAKSGEFTVSELAQKFGISRKTAHKWIGRHEEGGLSNLADRSRAPKSSPQRTPVEIERLILREKRKHPTWGAKKIRVLLARDNQVGKPPAISTIDSLLKRHGLTRNS